MAGRLKPPPQQLQSTPVMGPDCAGSEGPLVGGRRNVAENTEIKSSQHIPRACSANSRFDIQFVTIRPDSSLAVDSTRKGTATQDCLGLNANQQSCRGKANDRFLNSLIDGIRR